MRWCEQCSHDRPRQSPQPASASPRPRRERAGRPRPRAGGGGLGLDEALAVCLVLLEQEPEHYARWAARWGSRFVREADGLDLEQSAFALAALGAMRGRARIPAARALEELCELGGQERCAAVLERWLVEREL